MRLAVLSSCLLAAGVRAAEPAPAAESPPVNSSLNAVLFYQLLLGGSGAEDASIGDIMGPGFTQDEIAGAVERVVDVYLAQRQSGERFLDTYRRIGMEKFKAAAYETVAA